MSRAKPRREPVGHVAGTAAWAATCITCTCPTLSTCTSCTLMRPRTSTWMLLTCTSTWTPLTSPSTHRHVYSFWECGFGLVFGARVLVNVKASRSTELAKWAGAIRHVSERASPSIQDVNVTRALQAKTVKKVPLKPFKQGVPHFESDPYGCAFFVEGIYFGAAFKKPKLIFWTPQILRFSEPPGPSL